MMLLLFLGRMKYDFFDNQSIDVPLRLKWSLIFLKCPRFSQQFRFFKFTKVTSIFCFHQIFNKHQRLDLIKIIKKKKSNSRKCNIGIDQKYQKLLPTNYTRYKNRPRKHKLQETQKAILFTFFLSKEKKVKPFTSTSSTTHT